MKRYLVRLKKFIGRNGRRYGGEPFRRVRKFVYDTAAIPRRFSSVPQILRKSYVASPDSVELYDTFESSFHERHYHPGREAVCPEEGIVCMFDGLLDHGGLTDRIRGILTTWSVAKRRKIPFYINWTHPFPLDRYLAPASFDWRISPDRISRSTDDSFPVIIEETSHYHTHIENSLRLRAALAHRRRQTHVYTNADNARSRYPGLYRELFRPTPLLEEAIRKHLDILGERFRAFSFRFIGLLGDFTDNSKNDLPADEAQALVAKVTDEYLRLAETVPEGERILVTSDSPCFLRHIVATDPRVYVVPGDVQHLDYAVGPADDVWLKTFVDQQLLMHAYRITLMRTGRMYNSGFPRFAAQIGGVEFIDHQF